MSFLIVIDHSPMTRTRAFTAGRRPAPLACG